MRKHRETHSGENACTRTYDEMTGRRRGTERFESALISGTSLMTQLKTRSVKKDAKWWGMSVEVGVKMGGGNAVALGRRKNAPAAKRI